MNDHADGRGTRVRLVGGSGDELAARLDLPAGPPRAFAVFAHCFTCSKDLRAVSRLAANLTDLGFGLLRFDFTGLGDSDGDFSHTTFSSNVDDVIAAASWLREHHRAPELLVGHSLGGAAVIVAARALTEVRAVATIGAPSEPGHLAHLFADSLDEIEQRGEADVVLAGRRFTIRRELVDDLRSGRVLAAAGDLRRALLVLHSPIDNVVGVEHAAALYAAARHPKSFVALDGADHLLSRPADADFAASIVGAWAGRYVSSPVGAPPPPPTSQVVVSETTQGRYLNHVVVGRHRFLADEPERVGGFDAGPAPYDLLAAALGACTSMTLRMYAERKALPLRHISVEVAHERVHADDAAADATDGAPPGDAFIDRFTRAISLDGDLDDAQRDALLRIADRCPVHRTLERSSQIVTTLIA